MDLLIQNARRWTVIGLLVAVAGIVVQILSGHDYPTVPPGIVMLVVPAGLVGLLRGRWPLVVAALAAVFQVVGLFASGRGPDLVGPETAGDTAGLWLQLIALLAVVVTAVTALVRPGAQVSVRGEGPVAAPAEDGTAGSSRRTDHG